MKILSRYILREHAAPFIFGLVVTIFVLVIDIVPDIIGLIIGKKLGVFTVLWVFALNLAWMLALAVPMACMIATLMAFGRLSADFEMLAMKSSGINVLRMILPVLGAATLIAVGLIWFNNAVLPNANHKARVIMGDIRVMRPTLSIQSNIFINDIPGYFILIGDVDHKTSKIKDVLIYDQRTANINRTITADSGYLEFLDGGQILSFELEDGESYESDRRDKEQYRRVAFKKQIFNIRDINRELRQTSSSHKGDREMSTSEMLEETRILRENIDQYAQENKKIILSYKDPNQVLRGKSRARAKDQIDSEDRMKIAYVIDALTNLRNTRSILRSNDRKIAQVKKSVSVYLLEVHKKFSIPAACIVFVLIGAPLGMLGRRGGMGSAIGISVGLFIVYWAFLIGGEELSDRGITSPEIAMWLPNILIGAVGLILLYRVVTEKSLLQIFGGFKRSKFWIAICILCEKLSVLFKSKLDKEYVSPRLKAAWRNKIRMTKILDGYLLGKFVRAVILALLIFIIVMHLVHLIEHLDTYIDKKASIVDIVAFYVYYTPFIVILTIPVATLLGAIFTIGMMARRNEILAMKASGVSLWRISLPLLVAGLLISAGIFWASEKLLPYTNQKKSEIQYEKIEKIPDYNEEYYSNFHRRGDDGRIFNFRLYSPRQFLGKDIQINTYSENRLIEKIEAKQLEWKDTIWLATNGEKAEFAQLDNPSDRDRITAFDSLYLPELTENPSRFQKRKVDPKDFGYDQTISDLKEEIINKERNGISATHEKVFLMFKYSIPLSSFIIILIAVPLAADPKRSSPALGFAFAIGISFAYMIIFEVFRTLGTTGKIPPIFAAWSVNAIFFIIGIIMMLKVRK